MLRAARTTLLIALIGGLAALAPEPRRAQAQADPSVLERIIPAAVQIAIVSTITDDDGASAFIPVASGTVISATGLILTNAHAIDMPAHQAMLDDWEQQAADLGESFSFALDPERLLILGSDGLTPAQPRYVATIVAQDPVTDLAVLQIVADALGAPIDSASLSLPWVPLGDSDALRLAEPVDVLSYPVSGGDALTYTAGVVSGFAFEPGSDARAWINTDATISGGSSGGTAVNRAGELIGIPTQGAELDCRPGDTNRDGQLTAEDVGCIPVGGSIGQLRPVNLVRRLLGSTGLLQRVEASSPAIDPSCSQVLAGPEVLDVPPSGGEGQGMYQPVLLNPGEVITIDATPNCALSQPAADDAIPGMVVGTNAPDASASFVVVSHRDASGCATGAVYPVGTLLALVSYVDGFLPDPESWLPVGTRLTTVGPYYEAGECDTWPVQVTWVPPSVDPPNGRVVIPVGAVGFVDERTIRKSGGYPAAACITSEPEGVPGLDVDHPLLPPLCAS